MNFKDPVCSDVTEHPEYVNGRSYVFQSILHDELIIVTKLPALTEEQIPIKKRLSKFGEYDISNYKFRKPHFMIETIEYKTSIEFSPAVLRSNYFANKICFSVSWYSDLEYIGEL